MIKEKKIFNFQIDAVNASIDFLKNNSEFNLQSPTGSGKTYIIANIIDRYLENEILNNKPTTFLFIAPSIGKLDHQGYEKITNYLNSQWVKGYSTQYIGLVNKNQKSNYLENIDYFKENKVYFIGWSLFSKNTNIMNMESEKNDLFKVINNTKIKGVNIVLIIDEAHREVKTPAEAKKIAMEEISPYKTIKISATLNTIEVDYKITHAKVIEEFAIKKLVDVQGESLTINFDKYLIEDERLILSAIAKQKEIEKEYFKKNIKIKPLLIIQIPNKIIVDKDINTEDLLLKRIENLLKKNNFKKDFNYAIWLDKDRTKLTKEQIISNDSPIEILIFKQAIAVGWDIPRANMLVRIRDAKGSFNIQTLGRILRNPFFKTYNNDLIDNAFVFTKDDKYKEVIKEESFCVENEDKFEIIRSKKSNDIDIKINKIIIDKYNNENMIGYVADKILLHKNFSKYFEKNHQKVKNGNFRLTPEEIYDKNNEDIINNKGRDQQKLSFSPKLSLFDLYIKYKTQISGDYITQLIMDEISIKSGRKIKDFYSATISSFHKSIFNEKEYETPISIKKLIEIEVFKYQKNETTKKTEEYLLPLEYATSSKYFNKNKWDKINTFSAELKKDCLSTGEEEFYKEIKKIDEDLERVHLFRNGTGNQDYFINYFNSIQKISKFFPDFILINENTKKMIILEIKGKNEKNIDRESKNKFRQLFESIDLISHKNSYEIIGAYEVNYNSESLKNEYIDEKKESHYFDYIKEKIMTENLDDFLNKNKITHEKVINALFDYGVKGSALEKIEKDNFGINSNQLIINDIFRLLKIEKDNFFKRHTISSINNWVNNNKKEIDNLIKILEITKYEKNRII